MTIEPTPVVVLDVDGTLLDSRGSLSPRNRAAVTEARRSGARVVLATGKSPDSIAALRATLELDTPAVCTQGTVICDPRGRILESTTLAADTTLRALEVAGSIGLEVFAYAGRELHAREVTPQARRLHDFFHEPVVKAPSSLEGLARSGRVNKLLMHASGGVEPALRASVAAGLAGLAETTQATNDSLEVLPVGSGKGPGVSRLLELIGSGFSDVLAVGNADNDLELITAAAVGVAVGNATARLLAAADHVVASNDDDGVADALEHHLFVTA